MIWSKKKISPFLFLIACCATNILFAQQRQNEIKPDEYRVINWTMEDGLSAAGAHTMIKDAKGFLWIGSDGGGFCRFDGATFKEYRPDPNDRNTINSDRITSFTEDSLKNIWIGTDKGLSRYDFKADTFTNFTPLSSATAIHITMSSGIVAPIGSTKDAIFCLEPGGWITAFDIHTLKRSPIVHVSKDMSVLWNTNKSFFDAGSNSIWMLSGGTLEQPGGGIQQIFLDNGKPKEYTWPWLRKNVTQHPHGAEDMVYDSERNSIWINSDDGLLQFSLKDKQFYHIDALNDLTNSKAYERGVGIDVDRNGRVWFSTFYNGIFIYDPKSNAGRPVFSDPALQKKAGDANLHLYCDQDGIVWTSNWGEFGIYEILPHNPAFERFTANPKKKDSLSNPAINRIIAAANGEVWMGTKDGLNIFDTKTDKFQVLRQRDLPGIRGNHIVPVYVDSIRQKAWIRSTIAASEPQMDLYEMDLKTRQCKPIVLRDGTKLLDSFSVMSDWFRPYKNGLIFCDEGHGIFEIKENSLFADLVVPMKSLYSAMVLAEDRFIFLRGFGSAPNVTFENKNGKWIKTPHLFDSLEAGIFYNRKDQTYWVSFKSQLAHYSKDLRKIKTYRQADGYNGAHNMLLDDDDNLWFANKLNQVSRLNTRTGIITTIPETSGYQKPNFDHPTAAKDQDGSLYFVYPGGFDRIYPERYLSTATSSVYLLSLAINKKTLPLSVGVNNLEELSLRYNQNTISIETGIIDFYARGKGRIRYKLREDDNEGDWQYSSNAYYTIRYEKLPPGKYKLVLQASNTGNEFNSPEKILMFNISPPFWQTWWFRIAATIFIIASIYTIMRWRIQQRFRLRLERSEKERQVAELKQKATELEMQALRAQMNPHFIFNSLNSINRFILQNERAQASEYLTKFSKLVRMILQNSQASSISLDSELESLGLYLNLEALRFNYHFDYKVSVPKDLDISALRVPPLILQPYVENAIWHGLMHKEERGKLDIEVSEEDDHLYFKITDNGIGREKARALASKSATKHKSMGLRITAHRIAMLQNAETLESPVTINDLVNADGSAAGTEVVIKMPVIYD
jgi:streptogramin lyase